MSESNEQVPDVIIEDENDDSNQTDGPAPCEIQEVNKHETDVEDGVTEDVNKSDQLDNDSLFIEDANTVSPTKTIKRNVSFPGDGASPVIGYLEPPDPWRDVPAWTSQDLVAAYRKCCEKYSIRPLHKVIQQIQAVENIGQRYETLSVKGEKLDIRHCECLEEILRRVQFRTIDLEACHLDDETAVALFDMIEYYESACKVNISFNKNISFRGWQSCARLIRKTPSLTHLDARNCEINERVMPIMGRSLRMGCFLTTLHLENTNLSGRPLIILVAALKMNEILKELFLADNKLFPTDGIQLGNLLKYNHKLQLLDIRNNHLQDIGVGHVCDGVYEQNLGTGLLTLVLWNNQMSYQAMSAISRALTSADSLETLNLGHNNVTNEGIHLLKEGLLKTKSLLRIGLQGTKITCEGAVALAEAIADSPRLLRLDLRENDIKTAGLMALALALKVNETVVRLDLDKDTKRESGMRDYADQQRRLQQDINNYLERNVQASRQKEEERIKLEQKRQEEQDKAVSSSEDIEKDVTLIYKYDTIKRPRLLVMPELPAEQELDSPCCTSEHFTDLSMSSISSAQSPNLLQNLPPADLLLSPQYCPEVKAKKLFTVSKVLSPTSPMSSADKSVSELSTSSISFQSSLVSSSVESVVTQPGSEFPQLSAYNSFDLTDTLATQNVNNILQNMMMGNACGNECNSSTLENNLENNEFSDWSERTINNQSDSSSISVDSSVKDPASSVEKSDSIKVTNNTSNIKSLVSGKKEVTRDASDLESDFVPDIIEESDDVFVENLQFEQTESDLSAEITGNNILGESVIEESDQDTKHIHYSGSKLGNGADAGEMGIDYGINSENKDNITSNGIGNNKSANVKFSKPDDSGQKDSGIGSYENEHWTKIDSTEYNIVNGADRNKPNFHTTLTMNGLTQELASVLENLDGESTATTASSDSEVLTPPDEFERELDQMLANVRTGSNLPNTTETSLNISNSLNKTPEEILQEALESPSSSIPVTQ